MYSLPSHMLTSAGSVASMAATRLVSAGNWSVRNWVVVGSSFKGSSAAVVVSRGVTSDVVVVLSKAGDKAGGKPTLSMDVCVDLSRSEVRGCWTAVEGGVNGAVGLAFAARENVKLGHCFERLETAGNC